MRVAFGCNARKKPGMPMVSPLMMDIWFDRSGYGKAMNSVMSANRNEKMFLTRNRDAERWMLLMT